MYSMIYDAQLSTGECEHSLVLGCKHCEQCQVDEYEKQLSRIEEEEDKLLQYEMEKWEEEQQEQNENIYLRNEYHGIPLNRWNASILNEIIKFITKKYENARIIHIGYFGLPYVTYGAFFVYKKDKNYWLEEEYF